MKYGNVTIRAIGCYMGLIVFSSIANGSIIPFLVVNDGTNPLICGDNILFYRTEPSEGLYYRSVWDTGIGIPVNSEFNILMGRNQIDFNGNIITYTKYDYVVIQTLDGTKIGDFGAMGSDHPRVDDGRVVYHGRRGDNMGIHSIYCYTVDTGDHEIIYEGSHSQANPDISGDVVVWSDFIALTGGRVAMYDFSTDTLKTTNLELPFSHYHPIVSGNIVVWENGAYDLSTSTYIDVLSGDHPQISGKTLVYEKNNGIYGYNIGSQLEFMISQYGANPHIDDNIVVWEQGNDIYGAVVPEPSTLLLLGLGALMLRGKKLI